MKAEGVKPITPDGSGIQATPTLTDVQEAYLLTGQQLSRKLMTIAVAWLINLQGWRWHNASSRDLLIGILLHILGPEMPALKYALPSMINGKVFKNRLVAWFCSCNRTAKQHREKIRKLMQEILFSPTTVDPEVLYVRKSVFGDKVSFPLRAENCPVLHHLGNGVVFEAGQDDTSLLNLQTTWTQAFLFFLRKFKFPYVCLFTYTR